MVRSTSCYNYFFIGAISHVHCTGLKPESLYKYAHHHYSIKHVIRT